MTGPHSRVGLVLGGGGVVGQAYHAGALAAVEHDLGWDVRAATSIVGTSAGSITGFALRAGVPASGLAAWWVGAPRWGRGGELAQRAGARREFVPFRALDLLRPARLPGPRLVARAARRPWRIRPSTLAMVLARAGTRKIDDELHFLDALAEGWPDEELWICAVRRSDGARVAFGRPGAPEASPRAAVAASCAVPGYFAPQRIGGTDYVDGGAYSPTNADLLRHCDLDLVIVVSPMSAGSPVGWGLGAGVRRFAGRRLSEEVRRLRSAGRRVLVLEPRHDVLRAMGSDMMASGVVTEVVREAFLDAGAQLRDLEPEIHDLLATGQARRRRLSHPT